MIEQVRPVQPDVTQRVGALDEDSCAVGGRSGRRGCCGRSDRDGCDVRLLRARLGLESGYLSRVLAALDRGRLVTVVRERGGRAGADGVPDPSGARRAGRARPAERRRRKAILDPLGDGRDARSRRRWRRSSGSLRRRRSSVDSVIGTRRPSRASSPTSVSSTRGSRGFDPGRTLSDARSGARPAGRAAPGRQAAGRAVGCGALRFHDGVPGSLKRLWVARSARGIGLGRRLLAELEALR